MLLDEANDLKDELRIHDDNLATLNVDIKKQSLLAAEVALLTKHTRKLCNTLQLKSTIGSAKLINDICIAAEAKGKPIASSAKGNLLKTDVPLNINYMKAKKRQLDAEADLAYLTSLQYIIHKRGDLLIEMAKQDRSNLRETKLIATEGLEAGKSLYEKELRKFIT